MVDGCVAHHHHESTLRPSLDERSGGQCRFAALPLRRRRVASFDGRRLVVERAGQGRSSLAGRTKGCERTLHHTVSRHARCRAGDPYGRVPAERHELAAAVFRRLVELLLRAVGAMDPARRRGRRRTAVQSVRAPGRACEHRRRPG